MNLVQRAISWLFQKTVLETWRSDQYPEILGGLVNRDVYLDDRGYPKIHAALYGGGNLSDDRALTSAAVFGGIKIISEDIGSLSFQVLRRDGEKREVAEDHPLYSLLHDSPNSEMTAMEFREALTAHALLTGTGYAGIERSNRGRVVALWPWMPSEVRRDVAPDGSQRIAHLEKNVWVEKPLKDVFTLKGFGVTGATGLNLLHYARRSIGLTLYQDEYASRFFSNDATPSVVLKHPGHVGPEGIEGVKNAWRTSRDKDGRWHWLAVLQEGMEAQQLTPDHQKSQLIEQRAFQLLEVCRLLRLSPHKLADMGRATWGNVEQLNINHYTETLRPWCERWEQAVKLRLLPTEPDVYAKHNIAGFLRGDFKTQTEGFSKLIMTGVYSVNEVRALLDLNPIDGGDQHFIPVNLAAIREAADALASMSSEPKFLAEIEADLDAWRKENPSLLAVIAGRNGKSSK